MADKRFIHQENIDSAIRMLKTVLSVLDDYGIKYYLDFGTLIGAVREKAFIPWDDDIDISLLNSKDFNKIPLVLETIKKDFNYRTYLTTFKQARERRIEAGKKIYHKEVPFANYYDYQIAKVRSNKFWIFGRGRTRLDIFFKYELNGYIYWFADGRINKIKKEFYVKDLIEIDFYDMKCSIPSNYDEYLTEIYGDWKTPNKKWNHNHNLTLVKNKKNR